MTHSGSDMGSSVTAETDDTILVTWPVSLQVVYTIGAAASAAVVASYAEMAGGGRGGGSGRTPQLSLHLPPELWSLLGAANAAVLLPSYIRLPLLVWDVLSVPHKAAKEPTRRQQ
jgi:hypothetical protein